MLKLKKCEWLQTEVALLGHLVSRRGIRPSPAKVAAVKSATAPTNRPIAELVGNCGIFADALFPILRKLRRHSPTCYANVLRTCGRLTVNLGFGVKGSTL